MKKQMKELLIENISKAAVGAAIRTAKMPNQKCMFFLGEPHSEMAIQSKDYKALVEMFENKHSKRQ